jgi:sulfur-oxidizing protein SoxY
MRNRRDAMQRGLALAGLLAAGGWLPATAQAAWSQAAFEAKNLAEVIKALGLAAPQESKDVTLSGPEIAENGAVVPVGVSTALPGVKRLLVLVEKNPATLAAVFDLTEFVESAVSTRVKMNQSSNVYGVAVMADGRVLFAQKDIKVTLGGCGG